MKSLSEIQNEAREEKELLAFFESGTEVRDCDANVDVMRSWLDKEFLPVTLENLKACEKAISRNLEKKQKPFVPRPPAPAPKQEAEPVPKKHFLGERDMSPEQLARVKRGYAQEFAPLPDTITRDAIRKASGDQLKEWMKVYGNDAITERYNNMETK